MSIRILLADDHKIVREGLRTLLEKKPGMEVIAEAENGYTAVRLVRKLLPDVAIIDIGMPDLNGIEATRRIIAQNPRIKVIALSMHSDSRFVKQMLKAGASGYLLKDCAFEELVQAIRAVVTNRVYLSPVIANTVLKDYLYHLSKTDFPILSILTLKEREVLQLIAEGKTTKEIALHLRISIKTIETHRRQIMNKLDIQSIAELTKYAIREGLTFLET
jgi:DNA-binding NarL/FixJ family response regulator